MIELTPVGTGIVIGVVVGSITTTLAWVLNERSAAKQRFAQQKRELYARTIAQFQQCFDMAQAGKPTADEWNGGMAALTELRLITPLDHWNLANDLAGVTLEYRRAKPGDRSGLEERWWHVRDHLEHHARADLRQEMPDGYKAHHHDGASIDDRLHSRVPDNRAAKLLRWASRPWRNASGHWEPDPSTRPTEKDDS